jgi:hypothetical protein
MEINIMKKRFKIDRKKSKRQFSRTADSTHFFNLGQRPMRGGIRL